MSEKVRGSPSQPVDRRGHEVQQAKGSLSHNFLKLPRDIFYIQIKGASHTILKLPRDIFYPDNGSPSPNRLLCPIDSLKWSKVFKFLSFDYFLR